MPCRRSATCPEGSLGWPLILATSLGYLAGLANSYLLNSRWTFDDCAAVANCGRQLRSALFNLVGLVIGNLVVWLLALALRAWLAKLGAVAATVAWNFWSSDRLVFTRSPADVARRQLAARLPAIRRCSRAS